MNVLIVNGGSSSLKYNLFDMETETAVFDGAISNIGLPGCSHSHTDGSGRTGNEKVDIANHEQALAAAFDAIENSCGIAAKALKVVGHRVVHGADKFKAPVVINEAVDIAKKYGSEDSGRFVNGILGRIVRDSEGETEE